MKINNINDLANYYGTEVKHLEHDIYKSTDCGAWIHWTDDKVSIGSIVEGSEAEFSRNFYYPFDSTELDNWFEELEELVDEAWHEANDEGENYVLYFKL